MDALTHKEITSKPAARLVEAFHSLLEKGDYDALVDWHIVNTPWADIDTIEIYIKHY